MNPQKALIIEGERHLSEKKGFLEQIEKLSKGNWIGASVAESILLQIEKVKLKEAVTLIEQRLVKLNKEFLVSFEKESQEANEKMPTAIMLGQKYVGNEPMAISSEIERLIAEVKAGEMDQERKNDVYFELFRHINFFKNNIK